jgi:hypothetical protein
VTRAVSLCGDLPKHASMASPLPRDVGYRARRSALRLQRWHCNDVRRDRRSVGDQVIKQANPFRVHAYRNAALVTTSRWRLTSRQMAIQRELPGIGRDLAGKVRELIEIGRSVVERLKGEVPEGLAALLRLPGLGPTRVEALHHALGVTSLEDLRRALKRGDLARQVEFGPKLAAKLAAALATPDVEHRRYGLAEVSPIAEELLAALRQVPGVGAAEIAGSFRRRVAVLAVWTTRLFPRGVRPCPKLWRSDTSRPPTLRALRYPARTARSGSDYWREAYVRHPMNTAKALSTRAK